METAAETRRDEPSTEAIAAACIQAIAQAKDLPPESLSLESTFEQLALDSLDLVSLSFDLEEKYGVEIPEHRLHAIRSVGDLVAAIQEALRQKAAKAAAAP